MQLKLTWSRFWQQIALQLVIVYLLCSQCSKLLLKSKYQHCLSKDQWFFAIHTGKHISDRLWHTAVWFKLRPVAQFTWLSSSHHLASPSSHSVFNSLPLLKTERTDHHTVHCKCSSSVFISISSTGISSSSSSSTTSPPSAPPAAPLPCLEQARQNEQRELLWWFQQQHSSAHRLTDAFTRTSLGALALSIYLSTRAM